MDNGQHHNSIPGTSVEDEALHALFRHADPRQRPPAGIEREIRSALHLHWRRRVAANRRRRVTVALALAASVAALLVIGQHLLRPAAPTPSEPVAVMVKHSGQVRIRPVGDEIRVPAEHAPGSLFAGHEIETGEISLVTLRWTGGESIRVGENSRVRLTGPAEIELLAGSIYLDSGDSAAGLETNGDGLCVDTFAGEIRHIGTQYMARLHGAQVEVSVREGKVAIIADAQRAVAGVGEQVTFAPGLRPTTRPVPTWGGLWAWTENAAPAIDLNGRTVLEFLQHVARESGRDLAFVDAGVEDIARRSTLSGSIDLPPMEALDVVLQTTDLAASTDDGRILIHSR